jgi:hypothetical protein
VARSFEAVTQVVVMQLQVDLWDQGAAFLGRLALTLVMVGWRVWVEPIEARPRCYPVKLFWWGAGRGISVAADIPRHGVNLFFVFFAFSSSKRSDWYPRTLSDCQSGIRDLAYQMTILDI